MRKRYLSGMCIVMVTILLAACGKETKTVTDENNDQIINETSVEEEADEEKEYSSENADSQVTEEEAAYPSWCMDFEGIKNEDLGILIRKDNTELNEICLWENAGIYTPYEDGSGGIVSQNIFRCNYYEGNLDTYISECGSAMETGKIGNIDYAYGEAMWGNKIVFAGNGIMLSANLENEDESIGDFLTRTNVIREENELNSDYLAYLASDGLHCPALGITLLCEDDNDIFGMGVNCFGEDSISISIMDESIDDMGLSYYMVDTKNAQEVVDKYVEGAIEPHEYQTSTFSAIEGTDEVGLGKCNYLGRGVVYQYDWDQSNNGQEQWLFYSDESTWSISVEYKEGSNYKSYIHVLENLE